MYCPHCGQQRTSDATSFCSRCGFPLTGAAELLRAGGALTPLQPTDAPSPRSRGIRQGLFLFLLTLVVVPILGMISVFALRIEPWPMGIAIFLLGGGGFLRIAYALMFESKYPPALSLPAPDLRTNVFATSDERLAVGRMEPPMLPPLQTYPATEYAAPRAVPDTNDLEPNSVTESTTRHLEIEPKEPE